jgi:hypothetical protein
MKEQELKEQIEKFIPDFNEKEFIKNFRKACKVKLNRGRTMERRCDQRRIKYRPIRKKIKIRPRNRRVKSK